MEAEDQIRDLVKKILLVIFIFLLFFIPGFIIFKTKFGAMYTNVINRLDKEDTFVILFTKEDCNFCKKTKNILKNEEIKYEEINTDRERYYDTIIHKLEISRNEIKEPTVMYIKDGKLKSSLVNINNKEELILYLENNNISKE